MNNRSTFLDNQSSQLKTLIAKIKFVEKIIYDEINNKNIVDKLKLLLDSFSFSSIDAVSVSLTVGLDAFYLWYMFNEFPRGIGRELGLASLVTFWNLATSTLVSSNKSVFYNQSLNSLASFPVIQKFLNEDLPDEIPELKQLNALTPIYIFLEQMPILRHASELMLNKIAKKKFRQTLQLFGFSFQSPNLVLYDPENPHLKEIINQATNSQPPVATPGKKL